MKLRVKVERRVENGGYLTEVGSESQMPLLHINSACEDESGAVFVSLPGRQMFFLGMEIFPFIIVMGDSMAMKKQAAPSISGVQLSFKFREAGRRRI